jgi:hexosaminidase
MNQRRPWIVLLVFLIFFVISFLTNILGPLIPDIISGFHLSLALAGFLPFSFFVAYGVMSIPAGMLLERFREKPVMIAAFAAAFAGSLLFATNPKYEIALVSLFLIGIGMTMLQVAINPLLRVAGGEEHFAANSVAAQLVFGGASFVSPFVYSYLVTHPVSFVPRALPWVALYWVFAAVTLLMVILMAVIRLPRYELAEGERIGPWTAHRELLRRPAVHLYFLAIFCYVGLEQGIANWISKFLSTYHGFNPQIEGARAVAMFWGLMTVGCLLGLVLLKLFDSRKVLIGFAAAAILTLTAALGGGAALSYYSFMALGFFLSVMWSVIFSLALNSVDRHHGSFSGILCTAIVGGAFVSLAVGWLGERFGLRAGMLLLYVNLGYILSIGFWARPLVGNATVRVRELGARMKRAIRSLRFAALGLLLVGACRTVPAVTSTPVLPVIPAPAEVRALAGSFTVTARTAISVPHGAKVEWTARWFADLLARTRGLSLPVVTAPAPGAISFALDDRVTSDEGYELRVAPEGITVSARDPRGLLYGAVTLWQLLTADASRGPVKLAAVEIRDAPRFAWRGLMLDSARHYQSPEFIEHFIDTMALHKLNTLHWHLTDDQAWRLEIKKYPRLATIGGWRVPAGAAARANVDPDTGKPRMFGGIYTQDVVRHLVAYAAQRGITIVPEIEMPGHATAAIVAYPQLASMDDPPTAIPSDWGVYHNLYDVDEPTFAFLEDVLTEVMELFPSRYIHVGGDEAVKDQWKASAPVQARMRELGVADEAKLQSWFVRRIEEFLGAHGRRLIGWDEILEGGIAPRATVMSWRGIDGAVAAARAGHDAVLSPWPTLYLDNRQSAYQYYPPGRGRVVPVEEIYAFDPLPPGLTPEENAHILGVQGNIWTEHIRTEERVEYMTWPRGAAVAEIGWSPRGKRDWPGFRDRLVPQFRRYQALHVHNADVLFQPAPAQPGARRTSHQLKLCSDKLVLSLEDDGPVDGDRAVFLIDIMEPCWLYPAVDLTNGATLQAAVGQVPFNFQIGDDVKKIELLPPASPEGELVVFAGGCKGPRIASLPLAPAAANQAVTVLPPIALDPRAGGPQDLCFRFTQREVDPMWAIQWIEVRK